MNPRIRNFVLFVVIVIIGSMIGSVSGYVISGVITLLSLVFLIENVKTLKSIAYHCNKLLDIAIYGFGLYAKIYLGVTIGMAIMIAGLGYSMVYGPYIRDTYKIKSK